MRIVKNVRIERRGSETHPFSEVFITTGSEAFAADANATDRVYYTRLFHTLDDSPHARAAQAQDFLRRQQQELI